MQLFKPHIFTKYFYTSDCPNS